MSGLRFREFPFHSLCLLGRGDLVEALSVRPGDSTSSPVSDVLRDLGLGSVPLPGLSVHICEMGWLNSGLGRRKEITVQG